MAPLVSVITPFHDAGPLLRDAIDSVRAQRKARWELLLVDDGSTDESSAIARRAADEDPDRIRVLEHDGHRNRGPSASRNLGLSRARGELVAFLDADDVFLPFKLERQVALLEANPRVGMLHGKALLWHAEGIEDVPVGGDGVIPLPTAAGTVCEPPELLRRLLVDEDSHPPPCSLLIRREVCERIGGFDERFRFYEDTIFLARAYLEVAVLVSGDCSAVYRRHAASSSHVAALAGDYDPYAPNPAERAFLEWLEGHLSEAGHADGAVHRALRRRLEPYRRPRIHRMRRAATRILSLIHI